MVYNSIMEMIGDTPLVEFKSDEAQGARLLVKLESDNPTGSIKDRACIYHIRAAIKSGILSKDKILLDASSGNMACALAYYGKILGYKVKVVCNSKLTLDKKQFIEYFDAELHIHGNFTIEGNQLCREWMEEDSDKYVFLDQLHNPENPRAYFDTLAPEIHRDVKEIKAVVGSLGSGGNMCGTARYFKKHKQDTLVITAQGAGGTKIPGIGSFVDGDYISPFIHELSANHCIDGTVFVDLEQATTYTSQLASQGIFVGFQGGGVICAAIDAIKKYNIQGDVVAIVGDSGWKNMDKLKSISRV